jgi:hypothetical protein
MSDPLLPSRRTTTKTKHHAGDAPLPNALAYRINEVALMGGPKRTKLYELARNGALKLVRAGGRTLVDGDSLRNFLKYGDRITVAD